MSISWEAAEDKWQLDVRLPLSLRCYTTYGSSARSGFIADRRDTWTNLCLGKEGKPGDEVSDKTKTFHHYLPWLYWIALCWELPHFCD